MTERSVTVSKNKDQAACIYCHAWRIPGLTPTTCLSNTRPTGEPGSHVWGRRPEAPDLVAALEASLRGAREGRR